MLLLGGGEEVGKKMVVIGHRGNRDEHDVLDSSKNEILEGEFHSLLQ